MVLASPVGGPTIVTMAVPCTLSAATVSPGTGTAGERPDPEIRVGRGVIGRR
jgi:hypothetical protein